MIDPPKIRPEALQGLSGEPRQYKVDQDAAARELFQNEASFGTSLFAAATKYLTPEEMLSFSPYTIRLELRDALSLQEIDSEVFDRLMAAVAIVTTDRFYRDVPAFVEICNVLSGTAPDPDLFDPADAFEVAWAVTEARVLDGFDGEVGEDVFSEDVRVYMGAALADSGFFTTPPLLPMAIMPDVNNPTEAFADSQELIPAVLEGDIARHEELELVLTENLKALVNQLEQVHPGITATLKG